MEVGGKLSRLRQTEPGDLWRLDRQAQLAPVSSVASRNLPQIDDSVHASILANLANWSGVNEAN